MKTYHVMHMRGTERLGRWDYKHRASAMRRFKRQYALSVKGDRVHVWDDDRAERTSSTLYAFDGPPKPQIAEVTCIACHTKQPPGKRGTRCRCGELLPFVDARYNKVDLPCPAFGCGATVDRPKCLWELGGDCPRHEAKAALDALHPKAV
jgi:hypothetical protein